MLAYARVLKTNYPYDAACLSALLDWAWQGIVATEHYERGRV